jgi:hypothetical protein
MDEHWSFADAISLGSEPWPGLAWVWVWVWHGMYNYEYRYLEVPQACA